MLYFWSENWPTFHCSWQTTSPILVTKHLIFFEINSFFHFGYFMSYIVKCVAKGAKITFFLDKSRVYWYKNNQTWYFWRLCDFRKVIQFPFSKYNTEMGFKKTVLHCVIHFRFQIFLLPTLCTLFVCWCYAVKLFVFTKIWFMEYMHKAGGNCNTSIAYSLLLVLLQ